MNSSKNTSRLSLFLLSSVLPALFIILFSTFVMARANKKVVGNAWVTIQEAITSADSALREQVVQSLEFIPGEKTQKTLLSSLQDESEYVRIWAARSLIRNGNPAGKDTLLSIVLSGQEKAEGEGPLAALVKMRALARGRLRGEAAKVLGLFNDPNLAPTLRALKRDNDGRVRDGAAVALERMGDKSEGYVFSSAIKDADKGVRLAAVEALYAMEDPQFGSALQIALSDQEAEVRNVAVRALGQIKYQEASGGVAALLTDENGLIRENAAWALGEMRAKDKAAHLKASLSDPNSFVKIAAAEALGKMGDPMGLAALEAVINSNDTDARAKAAYVLYSIPNSIAESLAIKTLEDGNIKVRLGAAVSILRWENQ